MSKFTGILQKPIKEPHIYKKYLDKMMYKDTIMNSVLISAKNEFWVESV
jgi:hypothetical protein